MAIDYTIELRGQMAVMSHDQFWAWVRTWYDVQNILESTSNWDAKTVKEEVMKLRKILVQKRGKK